ncbi:lysophospholipid acyltransferase family protein [Pseudooceanicola nanhaiensis]|uniref:lysophospholipid acyltransferase family protein n=1 Tax=Pseudooceanicola nanhaiensis TaxID=375761 RepID=UPI001CD241E0|nr:lysophospholipid acyltransferase family protein [Pseudooceanicola nanhaiensis]MCA0921621.1 1-acyl-sn-glycerol-3-phosphate acyltransferase [Pseudooceanicola nanhaiensis]
MSSTWGEGVPPDAPQKPGALGWLLIALRAPVLVVVNFGCLALLLLCRLLERPLCGVNRPVTPWITVFVCRTSLKVMRLRLKITGTPMRHRGALVANHSSWLDIYTLNATAPLYFVSKAEVAKWPGIGWLAKATGTVFINRDRREAKAQQDVFHQRLEARHRLLFFPEGTSTDGLRVLPFKTTLFAAFTGDSLRDHLWVQPMSVIYRAPEGAPVRFYGWWGDMDFGGHLLKVLATWRNGSVEVVFHPPLQVADLPDRKALARAAEAAVRAGMPEDRRGM